ncbi:Ribosomal protein S5 domain 2-type fold [Amanita muscaria]
MTQSSISLSKAEKSYIQAGLLCDPPHRTDGRPLKAYRQVELETGVAHLANGSARVSVGREGVNTGGGTEVVAATKLEVEDLDDGGIEGGRIICSVSCSPAAYPHLSSSALEDLQQDMSIVLHQILAHRTLHPTNLGIIRGKKSWLLHLDAIVLSDSGNAYDVMFMAARAALWDTKVPRTRSVEYRAPKGSKSAVESEGMDIDPTVSGFDTRQLSKATDFELPDYWDEGEILDGRERWPLCVTLNLVSPVHYLDATLQEEAATHLRLLLAYSFPTSSTSTLQGVRLLGPGELSFEATKSLIRQGEKYALEVFTSLEAKLRDEDFRRYQKAQAKFSRTR